MKIAPSSALRAILFFVGGIALAVQVSAQEKIPLLILSGQNNHDWAKTTPALEKIFQGSGLFTVSVTNRSDTLKYEDYKNFSLIVSNWNSWPDTSTRLDKSREQAFSSYMNEGGGALFLHAGGSSFYGWEDYHSIAIGRWGKKTGHGQIGDAMIHFTDRNHPITQGLADFSMTDEIWENTEIHPSANSLGWAQKFASDGSLEPSKHPAILINKYGKGRSCYTILGHDEIVLQNPDLQQLLIRAATWTGGRETSVTGRFGIYQFHPDRLPHFHPLISPNGTVLTAESPRDHRWHMGLWFSWKFIDGLNYWEYSGDPMRHISEGKTDIQSIKIDSTASGACQINLDILYHPWDKKDQPVMKEIQKINISARDTDNSYRIDYEFTFTALKDLLLDRTPIPGEPNGQSWGGYSGMSIRMNTEFKDIRYFSESKQEVTYGDRNRWVACEFDNGTGLKEQVVIFDHPGNPRYPSPWYCINDPGTPMYYFSPAILYHEPLKLKKGEVLHLKYSVYLPGKLLTSPEIDKLFDSGQ
jgi:type 1 glutamine amidotransferase